MAVALTNTEGWTSAFPAWFMYFTTFSNQNWEPDQTKQQLAHVFNWWIVGIRTFDVTLTRLRLISCLTCKREACTTVGREMHRPVAKISSADGRTNQSRAYLWWPSCAYGHAGQVDNSRRASNACLPISLFGYCDSRVGGSCNECGIQGWMQNVISWSLLASRAYWSVELGLILYYQEKLMRPWWQTLLRRKPCDHLRCVWSNIYRSTCCTSS